MDLKQAGASLDSLISSFNARIAELQELVIARNSKLPQTSHIFFFKIKMLLIFIFVSVYPATSIPDLSEIDTSVKSMEFQMQSIKDKLREETEAIPKAKVTLPFLFSVQD